MTDRRKQVQDLHLKQRKDEETTEAASPEENLEDLNSLYEQSMEQNFLQKGRSSLLSSSQGQPFNHQQHAQTMRAQDKNTQATLAFDSRGITTSSVGTQSVQSLHSRIANLDRTSLSEVAALGNQVHQSPVHTDTNDLITNLAMKGNSRWKISGRRQKTNLGSTASPTQPNLDYLEPKDFRGMTAEGLYKREQAAGAFSKVIPESWDFSHRSKLLNLEEMTRKQQQEHEIVKNALDTKQYDFSSTIEDPSFSKTGMYRRNDKFQRSPYEVTQDRPRTIKELEAHFQQERVNRAETAYRGPREPMKSMQSAVPAKNKDPNSQDVHFFESPSRYIPLKVFNQLYGSTFSNQMEVTVQARSKDPKAQIIKKWFQSLSLQEQSVSITTVDKELVQLFKAMYKVYSNEGYKGGDFLAKFDYCNSAEEAGSYKKVGNYQLLYQQSNIGRSDYIGKRNQAANLIIEHTRIVSIKEPNDALTLDVSFISCYSFFLEIMKLIDTEFLQREYKVVKASANSISGSLLVGLIHQWQTTESSGGVPSSVGSGQRQTKEKPYFIIRDEHKPVYAASKPSSTSSVAGQFDRDGRRDGYGRMTNGGSDEDESLEMPGYQRMMRHGNMDWEQSSRERDENHVSFAKCLLLMFEKAINVQFQDYLDKLQQTAMQNFYFIGKNELQDNIFSEDLKIADFWQKLDEDRKNALMTKPLNQMIKDLLQDHNKNLKPFENIAESAEYEEDCDDANSSNSQVDQLEYDKAMYFLKKPYLGDRLEQQQSKDDTKFTVLPTEYTEFNSGTLTSSTEQISQFNSQVVKKPRRSRKDRRGGKNSETITSSSSGVGVAGSTLSASIYDYNPNQLTSQYGNQSTLQSGLNPNYTEDLELGIGAQTTTYSINNDQLSDQEDCGRGADEQMDPEALLPLTHFSNTQGGLDKATYEETKEPKKKKKLPKINVQVPEQSQQEQEQDEARNDLFSKANPESLLFRHKQAIISSGLKSKNDFLECLKFIKSLSANKNFEYTLKEFQPGSVSQQAAQFSPRQKQQTVTTSKKNKKGGKKAKQSQPEEESEPQNLSLWELTNTSAAFKKRMQSNFLKHLGEECQKSILDDLLDTVSDKPSQSNTSQKPASKLAKEMAAQTMKELEAKEATQSSQAQSSEPGQQAPTANQKKNKKKQKRKKNKRAALLADTGTEAAKTDQTNPEVEQSTIEEDKKEQEQHHWAEKVSEVPQEIELMPIIKKKKAKLSDDEDDKDQALAAHSEAKSKNDDDCLIEEAKLQQVLRVHQELAKVKKQDDQLEEIKQQYEKLVTVESFLDDDIDPQTAVDMAGLTFGTYQAGDKETQIDPRYIDMLQEHENLTDEELGLGNNLIDKNSNSKVLFQQYEDWIKTNLTAKSSASDPRSQAKRAIQESKGENDKLFQELHQLTSRISLKKRGGALSTDRHESDTLSDELQEQAQESLSMMKPVGFRPPMPQDVKTQEALQWQRFTEERRGLLSDEIHLEKYPQETLMDLSGAINDDDGGNDVNDIEDEQALDKRDRQEMLEHVLWNNYQGMSTNNSKPQDPSKKLVAVSNDKASKKQAEQSLQTVVETEKDRARKAVALQFYNQMQAEARLKSPTSTKRDKLIESYEMQMQESRLSLLNAKLGQFNPLGNVSRGPPGMIPSLRIFDPTVQTSPFHLTEQSGGTVASAAAKAGTTSDAEKPATTQPKKKNNKKNRRNKKRNKQAEQQQQVIAATTETAEPPTLNAAEDEKVVQTILDVVQTMNDEGNQKKTSEEVQAPPQTSQLATNNEKMSAKILIPEVDVEEVILDDNVVTRRGGRLIKRGRIGQPMTESEQNLPAEKSERDCPNPPKVNTFFSEDDKSSSANDTSLVTSQVTTVTKTQAPGSKQAKKEARKQRKALVAVQAQDVQAREKARNEVVPDEVVMIDSSSADGSDKEQESYVMDLTKTLISKTVNSATNTNVISSATASNIVCPTNTNSTSAAKTKLSKKKRKKQQRAQKAQQEREQKEREEKLKVDQAKEAIAAKENPKASEEETKKASLATPTPQRKGTAFSSKSSTTNSLANFDSSYNLDPFERRNQRCSTHRFRADLSDNISIPKRGTSTGSYGKREQEHSQLLQELDSLFPANNKSGQSNFSKIRSSVTKTRQSSLLMANHVGAFTTSQKYMVRPDSPGKESDIMLRNAVRETDILSQQQTKPKINMLMAHDTLSDLERSQSPRKAPEVDTSDTKLRGSGKTPQSKPSEKIATQASGTKTAQQQAVAQPTENQPPLTKAQQRKLKNNNKRQQQQQAALATQLQEESKQKAATASDNTAKETQPSQVTATPEEPKETTPSTSRAAKTTGSKGVNQNETHQSTQPSHKQHQVKEQVIVAGPTNAANRSLQKQSLTTGANHGSRADKNSSHATTTATGGKASGKNQQSNSGSAPEKSSTASSQPQMTTQQQQAAKKAEMAKQAESRTTVNQSQTSTTTPSGQGEKQSTTKTQQKKQKGGAAQGAKQAPMLTNNFSSYSNMFETVFGAKSTPTQAKSAMSTAAPAETKSQSAPQQQPAKEATVAEPAASKVDQPTTITDKKAGKQQQQNGPTSGKSGANNARNQPQKKNQVETPSANTTTLGGGQKGTTLASQLATNNNGPSQRTTAGGAADSKLQSMKPIVKSEASISEVFGHLAAGSGAAAAKPADQPKTQTKATKQPQYAEKSSTKDAVQDQVVASKQMQVTSVNVSGIKKGNDAPLPPQQQPPQQKHGGIGVMMTPSRALQTQVSDRQQFPQSINTFQKFQQRTTQFQSQEQQVYQQSYFQTPSAMVAPIQPFQPGPAPAAGSIVGQMAPGAQFTPTTTQVDKSKMVSSYFQTTTQKTKEAKIIQENTQTSSQSHQQVTTALSQSTTSGVEMTAEQQKQHRGVQFPFKNTNGGGAASSLVTPGSQVSSVQINVSIVNNQTTCTQLPQAQQQGFNPGGQPQQPRQQTSPTSNMYFNPANNHTQSIQMNIPNIPNQHAVMQYVNGLLQPTQSPQQQPQFPAPNQQIPFTPGAPFQNNGQQHPFMFQNQHQMMVQPQGGGMPVQGLYQPQPNMQIQQPFNGAPQQPRGGVPLMHQPQGATTSPWPVSITSTDGSLPTAAQSNTSPTKSQNQGSSEKQKQSQATGGKSTSTSTGKGENEKLQQKQQLQQSSQQQQAPTAGITTLVGKGKTSKEAPHQSLNSPSAIPQQTTPQQLQHPQQMMNTTQAFYHQPMPFNTVPSQFATQQPQMPPPPQSRQQQQFSSQNKFQQQQLQANQQFIPPQQFNGNTGFNTAATAQPMGHHPQHFPNYNQGNKGQMLPFQMQQQQQPLMQAYQPRMPLQPITVFEPISLVQALYSHDSDKNHFANSIGRNSSNTYEDRFFELIGNQILDMQSKIEERLSRVEKLRQDCFDKLFQLAKQTYTEMPAEKIEFKIYGSMATKLAIDTSDMDISIHGVVDCKGIVDSQQLRSVTVQAMNRIYGCLDALEWIESNMLIDMAKVPVIKLVINLVKLDKLRDEKDRVFDHENMTKEELSHYKQLKIDLIFNDILRSRQVQDPYTGETYTEEGDSQSTQKCAEFVKKQIGLHPFLKPLAIILKKYLALKSLNAPFQGTMSSYGLVLMILALLKDIAVSNPLIETQPVGQQSFKVHLGKVFAHFLFVYGEQFTSQHFSIDEGSEFAENNHDMQSPAAIFSGQPTILQVTDPIDPSNNVGKQTWNFTLVQDQLHVTWQCLLVRFKELYEKVLIGESLLKRRDLAKKAHELKIKRQNGNAREKQNENALVDNKIVELPTSQIFDYMQAEPFDVPISIPAPPQQQQDGKFTPSNLAISDQVTVQSQRNVQIERLANRSVDQLSSDLDHLKEMLDMNREDNQEISDNLLNMIVMIQKHDLTPLLNDDIEEKQKIMQQFSRDEKNYVVPLERLRLKLDHQQMLLAQPHHQQNNFFYNNSQKMMQSQQQTTFMNKHQQMPPFHHQQQQQQYSHFAPQHQLQMHSSPQGFGGGLVPQYGGQNGGSGNVFHGFNQQQFVEQFMVAANNLKQQQYPPAHMGPSQHNGVRPPKKGGAPYSEETVATAAAAASQDESQQPQRQAAGQRPALGGAGSEATSLNSTVSQVQYQVKNGAAGGKLEKGNQL